MSKVKNITFDSNYGLFQLSEGEYGTNATAVKTRRIVFSSIGNSSLDIYLGYTTFVEASAAVATAGAATRTATIPATGMIVPGTVVLVDDQAGAVTWTDDGEGGLTPSGVGSVFSGTSGTINYFTGALSMVYAGNPGIGNVTYSDYQAYIYSKVATVAVAVNPTIVVNENLSLYGRNEILVFQVSAGTPYAQVRYSSSVSD